MNTQAGPLAGRRIVVTRPPAQASVLVDAIEAAGGEALRVPLLHIEAAENLDALHAVAMHLADYHRAVFVSPNAVEHSLATLLAAQPWPQHLIPAAVGPSTLRALHEAGLSAAIAPQDQYDSEALLALPEFQESAVQGRRVLILRGDGGRALLAETLAQRGAQVDLVSCYRRNGPKDGLSSLRMAWQAAAIDAFTITSSEALQVLLSGLNPAELERLRATPLFVPHTRIAERARAADLQHLVLTKPADQGILEGLCAYNWPRP